MTAAPPPYLGVSSVLGPNLSMANAAVQQLSTHVGDLALVSAPLPFAWTDHYQDELGPTPVRRIVAFQQLMDPSQLGALKRTTGRLEVGLSRPGRGREVNLDPGMLNEHQLVLASAKPRAHRIYLGQGIYGDLMLLTAEERLMPLPWTYPDYADDVVRHLFNRLRALLLVRRRLEGNLSDGVHT